MTAREAPERPELETLRHFHRMAVERFFERRRLEWRLSFTVWGGVIAAGTLARGVTPDPLRQGLVIAVAVIAFAGHLAFEAVYFRGPSRGNWREGIGWSRRLMEREGLPTDGLPDPCEYRPFFAHWWQTVVTLVLAVVVVLAAWQPA